MQRPTWEPLGKLDRMLITSLPLLDSFYRIDQHYDVQNQAVPDPEEQHYLHRSEQGQRSTKPEIPGDHEPEAAHRNVTERVDDRISEIAEHARLTVPLDNEVRVLDHFPYRLGRDSQPELPGPPQAWREHYKQPVEDDTM